MREDFKNTLTDFYNDNLREHFGMFKTRMTPIFFPMSLNHLVDETNHYYEVALPGFTKEEMDVIYNKDTKMMTISAKKEEKKEENNGGRQVVSYEMVSDVTRSVCLDDTHDVDHIRARLENGILTITIPKVEKVVEENTKSIFID